MDLGCGPGLLALEMSVQVADAGAVEGIDASPSMMELALRRCAGRANVRLRLGDVAELPYEDAAFDAGVCTQVYEYVPDVRKALRELHRVMRPGGRVAIVDTDWESCVWHSSDSTRMRRVIDSWETHCPNPQLPRVLGKLLHEAEFSDVRCNAIPLINTAYHPQTFSYAMIRLLTAHAAKRVGEDVAEAWAEDLQNIGARDEYFFSVNRYLFEAAR